MTRQEIEELIYGRHEQQRRFTQDFPILPDVWIAFAESPNRRIELLLTPYSPTTAATLSRALRDRSDKEQEALERYRAIHSPDDRKLPQRPRVLFNESVVFANFTFEELIRVAMPLTDWWKDNMADLLSDPSDKKDIDVFVRLIHEPRGAEGLRGGDPRLLRKLITIVGTIECDRYQQRYANWPEASDETSLRKPLCGICPDLELFDLRVLGKDKYGDDADEFTVIAALQFIRHLNAHRELMTVHGVNLSMAVTHDVANYACGRTPICEECERVVANGVVVVTAAGNRGFTKLISPESGAMGDYRSISITDPGNAENVITVGATHRFMPHNYGVSYFSSRGPTGDGRIKPDLVAPGEKIDSCAPGNDFETMDGTSMAAPHVSGAAALLIARHRELIGQTKRVKEILCKSATDLGREPRFQGAGMLDVLRALQSV